jgi:hypothetical protein
MVATIPSDFIPQENCLFWVDCTIHSVWELLTTNKSLFTSRTSKQPRSTVSRLTLTPARAFREVT